MFFVPFLHLSILIWPCTPPPSPPAQLSACRHICSGGGGWYSCLPADLSAPPSHRYACLLRCCRWPRESLSSPHPHHPIIYQPADTSTFDYLSARLSSNVSTYKSACLLKAICLYLLCCLNSSLVPVPVCLFAPPMTVGMSSCLSDCLPAWAGLSTLPWLSAYLAACKPDRLRTCLLPPMSFGMPVKLTAVRMSSSLSDCPSAGQHAHLLVSMSTRLSVDMPAQLLVDDMSSCLSVCLPAWLLACLLFHWHTEYQAACQPVYLPFCWHALSTHDCWHVWLPLSQLTCLSACLLNSMLSACRATCEPAYPPVCWHDCSTERQPVPHLYLCACCTVLSCLLTFRNELFNQEVVGEGGGIIFHWTLNHWNLDLGKK